MHDAPTTGPRRAPRAVLAYVSLVGLPLAGLVIVLQQGGRLTAPARIGGEWVVEAPSAACLGLGAGESLSIEQSGQYLSVAAASAPAAALLDGERLRVELVPRQGPCRGQRVQLDVELARSEVDGDPAARLDGTLRTTCAACGSEHLRAHPAQ